MTLDGSILPHLSLLEHLKHRLSLLEMLGRKGQYGKSGV